MEGLTNHFFTKQKVFLMQSFLDGKTICRIDAFNPSDVKEYNYKDGDIDWDFSNYLYEVKEEPEYVPFENAQDFYNYGKQHGFIVRQKDEDDGESTNNFEMLITWDDDYINLEYGSNYDELLKNYVWADDNTPCGKIN